MSPPTVTRGAGTSQPARRRLRRRLSTNHVLIAVAVVLAFALNFLALSDRGEMILVAVADSSLSAGTALSPSDLRFVSVDAGFEALDSMITEGQAARFQGWILQTPLAEGDLVSVSMLIEAGAPNGLRSMSIPVAIEHAAGGSLVPGDRIDVVSVVDGSGGYVATGVEVLAVSEDEGGSLGRLGGYHIVVAVDSADALALAEAIDSGSVEIIRSTGASDPVGGIGGNDS